MAENGSPRVSAATYLGLFLVTLATLTYEILLTRIFSVSMWYHFAFMAISIAMFGMSFGAIIVYFYPAAFEQKRAAAGMAWSSLAFALAIPASFAGHLWLPFYFGPESNMTLALSFVVVSVPFVFSGICVCIALTRFPDHVSRLYAADLIGAALGCVALIYLLDVVDGPSAVLLVAMAAALGSLSFALTGSDRRIGIVAAGLAVLLCTGGVGNAWLAKNQTPFLRLLFVKGKLEQRALYETWNAFSRVSVHGNPKSLTWPAGWGLSATYRAKRPIPQLQLLIDATAGTVLTGFDGTRLDHLDHLKYDVTNMAHYLRDDANVLVMGVGGGRDVLSALLFEQENVVAVDVNDDILEVVNERFGDFSGHLDQLPAVRFVHDEARSFVARQDEKFDIIQASLVDTFTASAAGAYMLSEHTLYTREAWKLFLENLTPSGILTFSRFYLPGPPGETHRLAALASAALQEIGVETPRDHIIVVRNVWRPGKGAPRRRVSASTIMVSPSPFSERDLDVLEDVVEEMQYEILVSPRSAIDTTFEILASNGRLEDSFPGLPVDVSAPTDDNPFFFFMLKPLEALKGNLPDEGDFAAPVKGIKVLVTLLLVVLALTALCILAPLVIRTRSGSLAGGVPLLVFFGSIGTGFMLVEISQLQRLSVFLGHPVYGLSVVLFALLISSGLGSWTVQPVRDDVGQQKGLRRLALLVAGLAVMGALTPAATHFFRSATTEWRIGVAVALLFPIGLLMGMAFPLGMRIASQFKPELTPWFWGINGAASVCASVISVVLGLIWGITATYWLGVACYGAALVSFFLSGRAAARVIPAPVR
ncbi:MAG: hypothetical protein GY723_02665 [bacterium]|nr:hypothetical protein [bacterium]MCP5070869.1 hypothetical protein [bacterium]